MKNINKKRIITLIALSIPLITRIFLELFQVVYSILKSSGQYSEEIKMARDIFPYINTLDTTASFMFIAAAIVVNRDRLENLNIDKPYIFIFLCSGLSVFVEYISSFGCLTGLPWFIFSIYVLSTKQMNLNSWSLQSWKVNIVLFLGLIVAVSILGSVGGERYLPSLISATPIVIYEEVIFRGLLWGWLRELKFSQNKIMLIQGCLFWFAHVRYLISDPFRFWLLIPLLSLLLGLIVMRTRSIFTSSIVHLLYNIIIGLIIIMF